MQKSIPEFKAGDLVPSHGGTFEVIEDATLQPGNWARAGQVYGCHARVVTVGTFPRTYLETLPDGSQGRWFQGNELAIHTVI